MPTLRPTIVETLPLPGYCNHVSELHDGETRYLLADVEEYGTGRSTVQLWRKNWRAEPDVWELCWDLTRDGAWPASRKPGVGHSICMNPESRNLIVSIAWKGLGDETGTSGVASYTFPRTNIPLLQG